MRKLYLLLLLAVTLALVVLLTGLFGCGPETVTVPDENLEATLHTVMSDADLFGSGWLNLDISFNSRGTLTSGSFSYTFIQPGVFSYYCHAHPAMRGKVTVL